jgi:hypothetical protein
MIQGLVQLEGNAQEGSDTRDQPSVQDVLRRAVREQFAQANPKLKGTVNEAAAKALEAMGPEAGNALADIISMELKGLETPSRADRELFLAKELSELASMQKLLAEAGELATQASYVEARQKLAKVKELSDGDKISSCRHLALPLLDGRPRGQGLLRLGDQLPGDAYGVQELTPPLTGHQPVLAAQVADVGLDVAHQPVAQGRLPVLLIWVASGHCFGFGHAEFSLRWVTARFICPQHARGRPRRGRCGAVHVRERLAQGGQSERSSTGRP